MFLRPFDTTVEKLFANFAYNATVAQIFAEIRRFYGFRQMAAKMENETRLGLLGWGTYILVPRVGPIG